MIDLNTKLLDNPFSIALVEKSSEIIVEGNKREGFVLGENNHHLLTDTEKYIIKISSIHADFLQAIDDICITKVLLRRYPDNKFLLENGLNKLKYIQYHTEVMHHKVSTILDLMKLLTNEVFSLGLDPEHCNWKNLKKNIEDNNSSLFLINKYHESFRGIINHRNLNTHRNIFYDKEKQDIQSDGYCIYDLHNRMGIEVDNKFQKLRPLVFFERLIKNYKKKKIDEIDIVLEKICFISKCFLTSLSHEFNDRIGLQINSEES